MPTDNTPVLLRLRAQVQQLLLRKRPDLAEPLVRQILAIAPADPAANRQLASCLFHKKHFDEALYAAQRAVEVAPDSPLPRLILASIHSMMGNFGRGATVAEEALQIDPNQVLGYFALADNLLQMGQIEKALEIADRGLALAPEHCGLLRSRAQSLAQLHRDESAIQTVQQFLRLQPASAESHACAGATFWFLRRLDQASEHLLRALSLNANNAQVHKLLGLVRIRQRNFPEARAHLEQALHLHPGMIAARSFLNRLDELERRGEFSASDIRLPGDDTGHLSDGPNHWSTAQALLKQQSFDLAEPVLRKVLLDDPNHASARAELARCLAVAYRHQEALAEAAEAIRLRPQLGYTHYIQSIILIGLERFDEAIAAAEKSIQLAPSISAYHVSLVATHLTLEHYPEALMAADRGLAVNRNESTLLKLRACAIAGLGRDAEARQMISQLLQESPENKHTQLNAARVFYLLKDYDNAEHHALRAREIDPTRSGPLVALGCICVARGKIAEGKSLLEEALRLNPTEREARIELEKLAKTPDQT